MMRAVRIAERRVALVVAATDAFSEEALSTKRWRASVEGASPPQEKDGLYYLFLTLPVAAAVLRIDAADFDGEEVVLAVDALPRVLPLYQARLRPAEGYTLPPRTTILRGQARPGSWLYLSGTERGEAALLLQDYRQGEREIRLAFSARQVGAGKLYAIRTNDGSDEELFTLDGADLATGCCILRRSLSGDYSRASARVAPVYAARANAQGAYFLPVRLPAQTGAAVFTLRCGALDASPAIVRLKVGQENVLNLDAPAD